MSEPNDEPIEISAFDLLESQGSGAAGEVWKASPLRDLPFATAGDPVAIKKFRPDILSEPAQLKRIEEEYRTGSRLLHPNLVRIFDLNLQSASPFLIMEWLEGSNLYDWRLRNDQFDEEFLLQFTTGLLDALEFLHSSRRIHRDIKPKNIHLDSRGACTSP